MAAKKASSKKATVKRSRASAKQATSKAKASANAPAPAKKTSTKKAAPRSRSGANERPPTSATSSIEALQEKGWLEKPTAGMNAKLPDRAAQRPTGLSPEEADIQGRGGKIQGVAAETGNLFTPKVSRRKSRVRKPTEETTPQERMQTASEMVEGLPEASTRPTAPGEKAVKAKTVPARGSKTKREAAGVLLGQNKKDKKSKGRKSSIQDLERATDRIESLVKGGMPYSEAARHRSVIRDLAGGWRDDMGRAQNKARPTGGNVENADLTESEVRRKEEAELRKVDSRDRYRLPEAEEIEHSGGNGIMSSPQAPIPVADLIKAHPGESAASLHREASNIYDETFRQSRGRHIRESIIHHLSQAQLHKQTRGRAGAKLTSTQINQLQNIYHNANMVYGSTDRTKAVSFCSHESGKGKLRSCPNLVFGSQDDKCEEHGGRPVEEQRTTAERESAKAAGLRPLPRKFVPPAGEQSAATAAEEPRTSRRRSTTPVDIAQGAQEKQARSTLHPEFRVSRGRTAIRRWDLISPMANTSPSAPAEPLGSSSRVTSEGTVPSGGWVRNLIDDKHLTEQQRTENAARPLTPSRGGGPKLSFSRSRRWSFNMGRIQQ